MNLKLTIEGTASQLAIVLANLPDGVAIGGPGGTVINNTAQPAPQPMPMPAPIPPAPVGGDDDTGPVNSTAPALDKDGLPWDERIHAGTKNTNADGSWKKKRGASAETIAQVEAELRAGQGAQPMPAVQPAPIPAPVPMPQMGGGMPIGTAPAMPAPMPAQFTPPPMPAPVNEQAPVAQPMPAPVPAMPPVAQPAPAPAPVGPITDLGSFMQHLSQQMTKPDGQGAPLVDADYLAQITQEISTAYAPHGVAALTAITDIGNNPQMIEYAIALMTRDGRW